jgi:hypothetical protein
VVVESSKPSGTDSPDDGSPDTDGADDGSPDTDGADDGSPDTDGAAGDCPDPAVPVDVVAREARYPSERALRIAGAMGVFTGAAKVGGAVSEGGAVANSATKVGAEGRAWRGL